MKYYRQLLPFIFSVVLLSSCSITKYVPEGETLLYKVQIKTKNKNISTEELKPFILQKQNQETLGLMKVKLAFYSASGTDTTKWGNRWLRKIGEEPVIYDPYLTERSKKELQRQLANKGYMRAEVTASTKEKKRKTNVTYHIKTNEPYIINKYSIKLNDDSVMQFIKTDEDSLLHIKIGEKFDIDHMEAERERIAKILRNNGYFGFKKENLFFTADSTAHVRTIDLELKIRPTSEQTDSFPFPFERKRIQKVTILSEVNPWWLENKGNENIDSVTDNGFRIFYGGKRFLRPKTITSNIFIEPGEYYKEKRVERTYSALNYLAPIKYVNINFKEIDEKNLECIILINPDKNHVFSAEIEGTNSDGNLGVAGNLNYSHKNIFKGAEIFKIGCRGAYETMGHIGNSFYSALELGGNTSLKFPMFLFPIQQKVKKNLQASTEISIGYNYQKRPQYSRNIANAGFKYNWNKRGNENLRYSFDLLDISYIYLPSITEEFKNKYLGPSSSLRFSYEDHFIMKVGMGITYSTQRENKQQDYYTIRSRIKTAGNLLYGISNLIKQEKKDNAYKIFNIRYAQFVKGEIDISYNKFVNERNRFAFHFAVGIAYPYGNANILPFEERYFSGGSNSVRGWSVRALGPGGFKNTSGAIDFMRQAGDIKLDLSCEYRVKLFWLFEGALFLDAGNIWTIKPYEEQPEGAFKFGKFYKQIACGYGVGLRADFQFFIIRLDLGVKLYDPTQETSQQWRSKLKKDDFALQFAIGYPF